MKSPARPSLVISTSNNAPALNLVLDAVSRQTRLPAEVIVADDGSGPATAGVVRAWAKRLPMRVEHLWQPHQGFRKTIILNRAVRATRGDYLIFIDGDCFPHRRFVADHLGHAEPDAFVQGRRAGVREPYVGDVRVGTFSPLLWYLRRRLYRLKHGFRRWRAEVTRRRPYSVEGCNLAIWRDDFFRVNGYDESFEGWGHEDAELAARLINAGLTYKTVVGQAIVYHLDHPRSPRDRAGLNEDKLRRTKQQKIVRCELGIASPPAPVPASVGQPS